MAGQFPGNTPVQIPNFQFSSLTTMGRPPQLPPPVNGSPTSGVPNNNSVGSVFSGGAGANDVQAQAAAGQAAAAAGPAAQPVFWYVVMLVIAVIMLSHVARLGIRG